MSALADSARLSLFSAASERRVVVNRARLMAACTLLSRALGLLRDIGLAALLGTHWVTDAFLLAYTIPNLFRNVLGEGALTSAFLPVFTRRLQDHGKEGAWRTLSVVAGRLLLATAAFAALLALGGLIASVWGFDIATEQGLRFALTARLLALMSPILVLCCMGALFCAALQAKGRYAVSATPPLLQNGAFLVGLYAIAPTLGGTRKELAALVALCAVAGALLGALAPYLALKRVGWTGRPVFFAVDDGARAVWRHFLPATLGLAVFQLNVFADSLIARLCVEGDGAVTVLYFANRFLQLPLAIFGTAMVTAVFPVLSGHAAAGRHRELAQSLAHSLQRVLSWTVPAALGLLLLREDLMALFLGHGRFDPSSTGRTAFVLAFAAMALPFVCAVQLAHRAFHALGDPRTPMRWSLALVAVNFALNLVLVHTPLREAGLPLSTALCSLANALILFALLRRRLDAGPQWRLASMIPPLFMSASVLVLLVEFLGRPISAHIVRTLALSDESPPALLARIGVSGILGFLWIATMNARPLSWGRKARPFPDSF